MFAKRITSIIVCGLVVLASVCVSADIADSSGYIKNGGFEELDAKGFARYWSPIGTTIDGNTVELDQTTKVSGKQSLKITKTATSADNSRAGARVIFNDQPFKPGTKYTLSFYVKTADIKAANPSGGAFVLVFGAKDTISFFPAPPFTGTMRWQKVAYEFTAMDKADPSKVRSYALDVQLSNATGTLWIDDISLVESSTLH